MGGFGSKEITNSANHKGLENKYGENTCFLNVVVQSLWHLKSFRERLLSLDYTHIHRSSPCVFCSLVHVFTQYKFSDVHILPAKELRQVLHQLYRSEHKFRLGDMCDAEECFDAIVKWLHCEQVAMWNISKYQDIACNPTCISHTTFGSELCDIRICTRCQCTSDPMAMSSFVNRVYTADLKNFAHLSTFGKRIAKTFSEQKYSCPDERDVSKGDPPPCPPKTAKLERWCFSIPENFVISLIWPARISKEHAKSVIYKCLSDRIDLLDMFRTDCEGCMKFELCGIICFVGTHYVSFFWSVEYNQWLLFNDTKVTEVGTFEEMRRKIYSKHYQPTLMFFEKASLRNKPLDSTMELAESMSSVQMFYSPDSLLYEGDEQKIDHSQSSSSSLPTTTTTTATTTTTTTTDDPKSEKHSKTAENSHPLLNNMDQENSEISRKNISSVVDEKSAHRNPKAEKDEHSDTNTKMRRNLNLKNDEIDDDHMGEEITSSSSKDDLSSRRKMTSDSVVSMEDDSGRASSSRRRSTEQLWNWVGDDDDAENVMENQDAYTEFESMTRWL